MTQPILGRVEPDAIGDLLGAGFFHFTSPTGVGGLAREAGDTLHLLTVVSTAEGTGQFRRFLAGAQAQYREIRVWLVGNPKLAAMLECKGFAVHRGTLDGQKLVGMRWTAA